MNRQRDGGPKRLHVLSDANLCSKMVTHSGNTVSVELLVPSPQLTKVWRLQLRSLSIRIHTGQLIRKPLRLFVKTSSGSFC